jgi:hypothetical protein
MIWHLMNSKNIFRTFENVFKFLKLIDFGSRKVEKYENFPETSTRYIKRFQTLLALRNTIQQHECNTQSTIWTHFTI